MLLHKKALSLFILLLVLTQCARPCQNWQLETVHSKNFSSRLLHPATDCYSGISFEIIHSCQTEWGYINSYTFGFSEEIIEISIIIDGQEYPFTGERLEGHQRVLLPPQATQLIIKGLLDGQIIHLTAENYQTTLCPQNFSKLFKKSN